MLASGGGKLERACAPSLSFSGISKKALGPWGPAPAMSPSLKGGWRRLTMAPEPGLVAVLRIVPPGDKVALEETVWRVLSASSTPRMVFGGDARRKLARRASRWTRATWGLLLASLVAWPLRQPGDRCLSSSLAPPQDRKNCHVGGNVFVSFDSFKLVTLCNLYLH